MLTRWMLQNFKSVGSMQSTALRPLTVLIGANAAGKSNLLEALRLAKGLSLDLPLSDVLRGRFESGHSVWPGLRGGAADVVHSGADEARLAFAWDVDGESVVHSIRFVAGKHPALVRESLAGVDGRWFVAEAPAGGASAGHLRLSAPAEAAESDTPRLYTNARTVLTQLQPGDGLPAESLSRRDRVLRGMRGISFFDPAPARMRGYAPIGATHIGIEGEHLSAIAWDVCRDRAGRVELVEWLSELCAPEVADLDFVRTELGEVMLVLVERSGRRIPARSLSDGTLRFLGLLLALRSAPPGAVLLVEELENGLHPTRAHLLVEAIEQITARRAVQVIATTHSPLVLNALSPAALREAILVARPEGSDGTILRALGEVPAFEQVVARQGIDRMLASGWLERAL